MHPLNTHFDELRKRTRPPQERMDKAKELPPQVRDYLKGLATLVTVEPHSRLVGSYAQHLCVGDVKDVDFLLFIEGEYEGDAMIEPKTIINAVRKALKGLAEHLGYQEGDITVEAARRSVHVHFKDEDFHLDVVPCIAPNGVEEPVYVPCKNLEKWVKTHPLGYIGLLNEVNNANGKNVKPLARIVKHFFQYQMKQKNMRPKSYWLGSLLLELIAEEGFDASKTQGELFHWFVTRVYAKYLVVLNASDTKTPSIKDPVLGHNISWNYGRPAFEQFMARLKEAKEWSAKALAEGTSKEEAIELWQKIFGEEFFPAAIEDAAKHLAETLGPTKGHVEPSGNLVSAAAASTAAVPTLATRFHGGTVPRIPQAKRSLSPALQQAAVARRFPSFRHRFAKGKVTWHGTLQPREGSPQYRVTITYKVGAPPEVRVRQPRLHPDAPHVYSGGQLCLYWHKDGNWNQQKFVAETIIPWISQWLMFYELWLDTGKWLGPESPHRYPGKLED